jgi:molecular chaperone DnaK
MRSPLWGYRGVRQDECSASTARSRSPDARGTCAVELRDGVKPLEDGAVDILKRLLELVAVSTGAPVEEFVLTVPAHPGFAQRAVLRSAAKRACVRVRGMVNECTAASMFSTQRHKAHDRTILVFDLGGGPFDATLVALVPGTVKVLGTGGDVFLGGTDFDAAIVEWLVEPFQARHSVPLRDDTVAMQRLLMAAEVAKIELSCTKEAVRRSPSVTNPPSRVSLTASKRAQRAHRAAPPCL